IFPFVDSIGRINFRILAETARTPGVPWASWSPSLVREVEKAMEVEGRRLGRDVGCPRNANIRRIAAGEVTEGRREGGLSSLGNEVEESIRHASTSTRHSRNSVNARLAFSACCCLSRLLDDVLVYTSFTVGVRRGTVVCTSYRFYARRRSGTGTSRSPLR
ncbi:hypothetical protein ALC56_11436, partial [Trachymyrmex septentrionalis]